MTHPHNASRLLLIEDRRGALDTGTAVPLRRYRLARVRVEERSEPPERRFDYLKRAHD